MKSRKVLLALVLALVLCLSVSVAMAAIDFSSTTCTLTGSETISSTITLSGAKSYILNLNNNTITIGANYGFIIKNGATLTVNGPGTINVSNENAYVFAALGTDTARSTLTIEENVVINAKVAPAVYTAKNSTLNLYGIINQNNRLAPTDGYPAVTGNGYNNDGTIINIGENAEINTNGMGIYHPQVGTLNIHGKIVSDDVGVEVRAGTVNVYDTAVIKTTSTASAAVESTLSGSSTSNVALAISQHTTNKPTTANIMGGSISAGGSAAALYTVAVEENSTSPVVTKITGGKIDGAVSNKVTPGNSNNSTEVTGGSFTDDSAIEYVPNNTPVAEVGSKKVVGTEDIVQAAASAGSMTVIQGNLNANINGNVTVTNRGNGTVVVNDTAIAKGSSITFTVSLKNRTPQTGDNSQIVLWFALLAISAVSFVALGRKSRFN